MNHTKPARPIDKRLELQKPVFFAGQYLSELDLQSIVTWADKRVRFAQHGQPWGIVEGLYVSVLPGESQSARGEDRISISPGWAFNARHELCISDRPIECPLPGDDNPGCEDSIADPSVGPWISPADKRKEIKITQMFDLYAVPFDAETQHTLGASVTNKKNCHASRSLATIRVLPVPVHLKAPDSEPRDANVNQSVLWFLQSYTDRFKNTPPLADLKIWLKNAEQSLPGILRLWPNIVDTLPADGDIAAAITNLLAWCCFSLRVTRMPGEAGTHGIPLARLWITRTKGRRRVFWIDERPQFRKLLSRSLPQFTCAEWIGADYSDALASAKLMDVTLSSLDWQPTSIDDLKSKFANEPKTVAPGKGVQALVAPLVTKANGPKTIIAFAQVGA